MLTFGPKVQMESLSFYQKTQANNSTIFSSVSLVNIDTGRTQSKLSRRQEYQYKEKKKKNRSLSFAKSPSILYFKKLESPAITGQRLKQKEDKKKLIKSFSQQKIHLKYK